MTGRADYQATANIGMKALGGVYLYVARSGLPEALMNLVYLRASQINGCAYCIDLHAHDAMTKDGALAEKLLLVSAWRETGAHFTERERAALAWTETVTRIADTHAPDREYQSARAAFTEKELADLTIGIGLINAYNRIAISFRRAPDSRPIPTTVAAPLIATA